MFRITVPGDEAYDEKSEQFTTVGDFDLELEHSLVSLSKWESIFEKPFLSQEDKTGAELLGYVKAMTLTPDVPDEVYERLSEDNLKEINAFIEAKMTATWFSEDKHAPRTKQQVITSELIYYWMTVFNIPFECQHWHLNRLFTLIQICNVKQEKPKKMSQASVAARYRELNAQRKKELGTKG